MASLYSLYTNNKDKALTLADQAVVSGGNFTTSLLYARLLGLDSYGVFVIIWMVILFASAIQQAFIFSPMINSYIAKETKEQKDAYINTLFFIHLGYAAVCMLIIAALILVNPSALHFSYSKGLIHIIPLATAAYLSHDFFRKKFTLQNKISLTLWLDVALNLLLIGLVFILYKVDGITIWNLFFVIFCSYSLTSLAGFILAPGKADAHSFRGIIKDHWGQGKWLMVTAILQWFSGNYFILAAGSILGARETGIIRIAQNIVGALNILFIAIESYIPLSSSRIFYKYGVTGLFTYLKNVTAKGLLVTTSICVLIAVFAEQLVHLLYGSLYVEYAYVVQIFAFFYILVFMAIPLRFAIRTLEHNHNIFIGYLISAAFSLLAAHTMVQHFGIFGALGGIIITQLLTQFWYVFSLKKYLYEYYTSGSWKSQS